MCMVITAFCNAGAQLSQHLDSLTEHRNFYEGCTWEESDYVFIKGEGTMHDNRRHSLSVLDRGLTLFGENRVQEAKAKIPDCPGHILWLSLVIY